MKFLLEQILYPSHNINTIKLAKAIEHKAILITGASYGIGESVAYKLAGANTTLILVARTTEKLEYIKTILEQKGATVYIYSANLQLIEEVDSLIESISGLPCKVNTFISNAGRSINRSVFKSLDRFQDFTQTMTLNYSTPVKLMLYLIPILQENKGQVINISTINALIAPPPFWSAYVASKSAFDNWLRSVAPELWAKDVAVTSIYLGLVRTRMIEPTKAYDNMPAGKVDDVANIICKSIIKRNTKYAPWWTLFAQIGLIIFRRPWEILSTKYVKQSNDKGDN